MTKVLMSIKPEYVEKILNGTKKYEYRKTKTKLDIDKIIIYSTNPVKKVVAEVEVKNILIDTPENIWNKTKEYSGTTKKFYDAYFKNKKEAIAYELDEIKIYDNPKTLSELGINNAPQSYMYIN